MQGVQVALHRAAAATALVVRHLVDLDQLRAQHVLRRRERGQRRRYLVGPVVRPDPRERPAGGRDGGVLGEDAPVDVAGHEVLDLGRERLVAPEVVVVLARAEQVRRLAVHAAQFRDLRLRDHLLDGRRRCRLACACRCEERCRACCQRRPSHHQLPPRYGLSAFPGREHLNPPSWVVANIATRHNRVNEPQSGWVAGGSRADRASQDAERSYSSMNSPVGPMICANPASFGGKNHVPSPLDSTRSAIASRSAFSSRKWFDPR